MNNRDNNENIYRHLEKCYALLQVHILFSFHTLIYYYLVKPVQIYGILLNIRGILLNIRGKKEKNREYRRKSFLFFPQQPDFML